MNIIELEKWKHKAGTSHEVEYVGQPTAQEVFEELKHRLDAQGYLPDEYFLMDSHWEDGREIPRDADIFCAVDYGESEGVYLDVYLKWYDEAQQKDFTKSFITGKTLGENGNDLDRMFLTASAVTKAFHGDHSAYTRYMKIGGVEGPPCEPSAAGRMGKGGATKQVSFCRKAEANGRNPRRREQLYELGWGEKSPAGRSGQTVSPGVQAVH